MVDAAQAWADLQPKLAEAAREERDIRAEAWLDLPKTICGIEVEPLTLKRYTLLVAAESPFVTSGKLSAGAITQFLWFVSKEFCWDEEAKGRFIKSVRNVSASEAYLEIAAYLEEALFDAPKPDEDEKRDPSSMPVAASIVHTMCSNYGWTAEEVMDTPIARILQLLNVAQGNAASPFRDKLHREWLEQVNGGRN